jgi:hypothetical protein
MLEGKGKMNIYELAILHDLELTIKHRNVRELGNRKLAPFYCIFNYSSTKRDTFLEGTFGEGQTPQKAIDNYVLKLRGKTLVVSKGRVPRIELNIPETLVGGLV